MAADAAGEPGGAAPVVSVRGLRVSFPAGGGTSAVVDGLGFDLFPGEALALVGESGCGKTMTALAILGLVPPPGRVASGEILFLGKSLLTLGEEELRRLRGSRIAMVFQDAASALDPVVTVGAQIAETVRAHRSMARAEAERRAVELLASCAVPSPELRARAYPHELSTGLKQRAMVAMALACEPCVLIADEPTTALDVTLQAQVLDLFREIQTRRKLSMLFITHDLGVVAEIADRVVVVCSGRAVEEGPVLDIFDRPAHPYTRMLFRARWGQVPPAGPDAPRGARASAPGEGAPPACPFAPRCPDRLEECARTAPSLVEVAPGRRAACLRLPEGV